MWSNQNYYRMINSYDILPSDGLHHCAVVCFLKKPTITFYFHEEQVEQMRGSN